MLTARELGEQGKLKPGMMFIDKRKNKPYSWLKITSPYRFSATIEYCYIQGDPRSGEYPYSDIIFDGSLVLNDSDKQWVKESLKVLHNGFTPSRYPPEDTLRGIFIAPTDGVYQVDVEAFCADDIHF